MVTLIHATLHGARMIGPLCRMAGAIGLRKFIRAEQRIGELASGYVPQNVEKKKLLDSAANAQKMANC
jgi:hypothetical protein